MTTFDQRIELRLSQDQLATIDRAAESFGMKRSQWIRFALSLVVTRRLDDLLTQEEGGKVRERESTKLNEKQWKALWNEWVGAIHVYQTLEKLGDSNNVKLLNAVDGSFFGLIQRTLYYDLAMRLARITEEDDRGRATLNLLGTDDRKQQRLTNKARAAAKRLRALRNRRIAHNYPEGVVPDIPTKDLTKTLYAIHAAMEHHSVRVREGSAGIANPLGIKTKSRRSDPYSVGPGLSLIVTLERLIRGLAYATKDWPNTTAEVREMAGEEGGGVALNALFLRDRLIKDLVGFQWSSEADWGPGSELDPRQGVFGNEY